MGRLVLPDTSSCDSTLRLGSGTRSILCPWGLDVHLGRVLLDIWMDFQFTLVSKASLQVLPVHRELPGLKEMPEHSPAAISVVQELQHQNFFSEHL